MDEGTTSPALIEKLRTLVHHYREKHCHKTSLFWADKVASLSKYEVQDVYNLAQCMFSVGEYERAALFIRGRGLHEKYAAFRYLAAKCYAQAKEWQQALDLLEDSTFQVIPKKLLMDTENVPGLPTNKEMQSAILLLKGDIYEAKDTRQYAAQCYEEALLNDVFCFEAYDRLISHHLLFSHGEQDILETLPLSDQCQSDEEKELIMFLYGTKIKRYSKPFEFEIPQSLDNLHENLEVATALAERHYYSCEFRSSYKITSGILRSDPYHSQCLPLHIALLTVLKKSNELFYLAHRLIKLYPESAVSWYAVGCYYLLQPKKQELTRRYLLKATLLDKMYGPAWLALGHSFALEGEHDQAMAAYFTATQLMRGSHLPYLYSGIEYSVTNNLALTDKFFNVALQICPDDPHVLHEIGVASYNMGNYAAAVKHFMNALDLLNENLEEVTGEEWEALLNNLGHTQRKLKNYHTSLKYHKQALVLAPQNSQTYTSIGFVLSYLGRYGEALEYLHKALGLKRDDVFAVNLIEHVISQYADSEPALSENDASLEDDSGPPPPFSHNFNEQDQNLQDCDDMEDGKKGDSVESSRQMLATVAETETETPIQGGSEKNIASNIIQEEGIEGFYTPDDLALARQPLPVMKNVKKLVGRSRRPVSSPAPVPLNFSDADTPGGTAEGALPLVISSRKMLTLVSSESSDDGGLSGVEPTPDESPSNDLRQRAPSSEEAWSTSVLKGGGGGFEPSSRGDIPGVSDSVMMLLGDSGGEASDSYAASMSGSQPSDSATRTPIETRSQALKRARDSNDSSDMEMDDTLD